MRRSNTIEEKIEFLEYICISRFVFLYKVIMQRVTTTASRLGARNFSATADPFLPVRKLGSFGRKLRDVPNQVPETQKFFKETAKHTFMKKDTDKFVQGFVFSLFTVGMLMFMKGRLNIFI